MSNYNAEDITILEGLEPVRKRPGMYIGGVGKDGLHHLLWEIVDNSVDEAIAGHASRIQVTLHRGGQSVTVDDNGRGIPIEPHPKVGRSTLEVILTTLHAGGKFDQNSYQNSGGLHGVGSSVVNALSKSLVARVKRNGRTYEQSYRRGKPLGPVADIGPARGTGTQICFHPDDQIFDAREFDADAIVERLEVKTYLHKGLRIVFRDESAPNGNGAYHEFRHDGGIVEYLGDFIKARGRREVADQIFCLEKQDQSFRLELALCWTESTDVIVHSFANGIPTHDGGTHESGLRDGLNRAMRDYIEAHDLTPRGVNVIADDIREGLTCALNLFLPDPQFQGQTKEKLNNPEIRGSISGAVKPTFEHWLNQNQTQAHSIVNRIIQSARARLASRSAAASVRRKTPVSHRLNLPGKLADCSRTDQRDCELFLVEGDSAGGSAKQGRDRETQAILPLRGKVLNAEQATDRKVLQNQELSDIIKAIGVGVGKDLDLAHLRYDKIILLMDADSDGHHIATLLLTFFYRYLRQLIDEGHVFIARPPLYRIDVGKETYWAADEAQKERIIRKYARRGKPEIMRFKGLGEMMPQTLYKTTLDPYNRRLLRVRIAAEDGLMTETTISELMGKDPSPRFEFVMQEAHRAESLDI